MKQQKNNTTRNFHAMLFTVTPLSKYMALSLFIILPFLAFYLGYTVAMSALGESVSSQNFCEPVSQTYN